MKKYYLSLLLLTVTLLVAGCDRLDIPGMFVSSGTHTEDRVEQWLDWNSQHGYTTLEGVPDQYNVYICSDAHVTDTAPRVALFLAHEAADTNALFSIINGDLANERGERPFRSVWKAIQERQNNDTVFCVIGNHDIYFDCQQYYQQYFHTSTYYVVVVTQSGHKDLFIFLDSGNATHGKRQLDWLRELLKERHQYRNVVVCSHTSPFRNVYNTSTTPCANIPEEEGYALQSLLAQHQVNLFLCGHFHHREQHNICGVDYVMTDNLNEESDTPSYGVITLSDKVDFEYRDL